MTSDPCPLMIFAAGFGTRMGPLTATRPKPLLRLGGQSLLQRSLALGRSAGCAPIVVNAHYLADQIEDAIAGENGVLLSRENPDILDTGGGLQQARPLLGADIVSTINPDALFLGPNPISFLRANRSMALGGALLLMVEPEQAEMRRGGGDFSLTSDGRLIRGGPLIYTGAQLIDLSGLGKIPHRAFSLNAYWDLLAERGVLRGVLYPGRWCDVGNPAALAQAETLLEPARDD